MNSTLVLSAYDLSDEGTARSFNEDATLVRDDLGLFAVADGAGGKGRGDVASALALRTVENYVGATVRQAFDRPDFDRLGNPEQARRLSRAIHQAHKNLREAQLGSSERAGMATTIIALILGPRTGQAHIAHVGDSRCYRLRAGRLELLTEDHSIARDVLERRPDVSDDVLARLPRNSVVRALGLQEELRVTVRSVFLAPGDRFLLCSDGLSSSVHFDKLWRQLKEPAPPSVIASELLSMALASESRDNISLIVIDCDEQEIDDAIPTKPYNQAPLSTRALASFHDLPDESRPDYDDPREPPSFGPEIATDEFLDALESWDEEPATVPTDEPSGIDVSPGLLERPAVEVSRKTLGHDPSWDDEPPPSYNVSDDDVELETEGDLDVDEPGGPTTEKT